MTNVCTGSCLEKKTMFRVPERRARVMVKVCAFVLSEPFVLSVKWNYKGQPGTGDAPG